MSDRGPTVFSGRYELHRRIGKGGMAEVSLARDQLLDRPVAIKVLFPEFATDPAFVERFRREATAAANLSHPNIVGVYDWGEAEGTYFIVMEYVNGRTLSQILRADGPLHPDRVADLGADVAAALGFAHRNGVVHRDVKPGNVLVDQHGLVKVADFGIARAITATSDEHLTQVGTVMGTATYFSPEQARGDAVDPRSDIYSLGCVLYELVVGRPPFSGDSPVAIAYKQVHESPVPPRQINPSVPPALEAIILKCLAKNPVNRYPSAEDLRADLRRFREGNRILAEPVMAPPVPPRDLAATGVLARTSHVDLPPPGGRHAEDLYVDDYDEGPRRNSGAFLAVLAVLLVLLAGMLILLARQLGVGNGGNDAPQVEVPRVIGETLEDARATLEGLDFEVTSEEEANVEFDEGRVFDQDPARGAKVDRGSTVHLKVSLGRGDATVPDVVGRSSDEASELLDDAGFTVRVEAATEAESKGKAEDEVVRQNPTGGVKVRDGSTVTIYVAAASSVEVPKVEGLTVGAAQGQLETAGFATSTTSEASSSVPQGRVIRTEPGAGTLQRKGATITIVVSSGKEEVTIPNVVGLSEAAATQTLEDAGFVVNVSEEGTPNPANEGKVIRQSRTGRAPSGSTVDIVVGAPLDGDGD